MALKVYTYKNCSTCRKATQWLEAAGVAYTELPIREQPPSVAELKKMLKFMDGALKKLFNTSGGDYKELKLKDTLPKMTEARALDLLSKNGNLVKRPFALSPGVGVVGFNEEVWQELFG